MFFQTAPKASQSFLRKQEKKSETVFGPGVYVDKNTLQAASVKFVCLRQTNYARSRLQKTVGKGRRPFSTSSGRGRLPLLFCFAYGIMMKHQWPYKKRGMQEVVYAQATYADVTDEFLI